MKALVIYDSLHGNTEKIARAIGDGLSGAVEAFDSVEVVKVGDVQPDQLAGTDLLLSAVRVRPRSLRIPDAGCVSRCHHLPIARGSLADHTCRESVTGCGQVVKAAGRLHRQRYGRSAGGW